MRFSTRLKRIARSVPKGLSTLFDRYHPLLVHIIATRRCNLACAYCNEYDSVSAPVPTEVMEKRLDHLARLRTSFLTFSGGEPLLHPDLDRLVAHARERGMVVTMITNGYHLSPERIRRLNVAGLDHLQISIDNVEPDDSSMKSLRLLEPKLLWLREHADFSVAINSVVGSGIRQPEDALVVARRARALGFMTSLGIIHDGHGQLRPLGPREMKVYEELRGHRQRSFVRLNHRFQDNLARGLPNEWSCRAGARYLYVDEDGKVSYCSQQRGVPGIPLESYGLEDVRREYSTRKECAPYCTVNCVQQVGFFDNWRSPQKHLVRLPMKTDPAPASSPREDGALAG
jgi:MoaA/NifB/PqqE/SkfB family radical SAM enzyme